MQGRKKTLSFKFETFYSDTEVSRVYSNVPVPPWYSIILPWPLRKSVWPPGGPYGLRWEGVWITYIDLVSTSLRAPCAIITKKKTWEVFSEIIVVYCGIICNTHSHCVQNAARLNVQASCAYFKECQPTRQHSQVPNLPQRQINLCSRRARTISPCVKSSNFSHITYAWVYSHISILPIILTPQNSAHFTVRH